MRKRGVAIGHLPRPAAEEQKPEPRREPRRRRTPEPSGESHIRPTIPRWPDLVYSGVSAIEPRPPRADTGVLRRSIFGTDIVVSPHVPPGRAYVVNGATLMISESDQGEFRRIADVASASFDFTPSPVAEPDPVVKGTALRERMEQFSRAAQMGVISMEDLGNTMRDLLTWRDPFPTPEPEAVQAPPPSNLDSRGRGCFVVGFDPTSRRPMTREEIAEVEDADNRRWVLVSIDDATRTRNYCDMGRRP
jgi:hypothetical protein